jgi:acylphosphatase
MKKQAHIFYIGRVQGVGFRYTVQDIAREMNVSGWVKNLHDGRVEVAAEQEEERLIDFLDRVGHAFRNYIQNTDVEWLPATGAYKDLTVAGVDTSL